MYSSIVNSPPFLGDRRFTISPCWDKLVIKYMSSTSMLSGISSIKMSQIMDPSNPPVNGVVLVWPSGCQDTKTCTIHMPVMLVEPWDHLAKLLQHYHSLFLSTLVPSCTRNQVFDQYLPIKTLYMALYVTVFKTSTYVRGFQCIFRVWQSLYTEKGPISTWAETYKFGWLKKLNRPWNFKMKEKSMRIYLDQTGRDSTR